MIDRCSPTGHHAWLLANDAENSIDPEWRKETLEFIRINQKHKTIRTIAICATITACVVAMCWSLAKIFNQPVWPSVLLALVAPSGVIMAMIKVFQIYVKRTSRRVTELEHKIDPERTSSGLKSDGRSPDGL